MNECDPAVHRTIVCVDVEKFGLRADPHQVEIRKGLRLALAAALEGSDVDQEDRTIYDRGDGALILVSPRVPKSVLVTSFLTELASALDEHNEGRDPLGQIQLRAAVHAGEVIFDGFGVTSRAVNLAFRLLEAPALKQAMASSSQVLGLMASRWVFEEVVRQAPAASPEAYALQRVTVKETRTFGWMRLLGGRPARSLIGAPAIDSGGTPGELEAYGVWPNTRPGPLLARMELAAWLRQLRESAGVSRERAAVSIGRAAATLGRWERAESGADPAAVADLLTYYGMHATPERSRLICLAEDANTPGWVQSYRGVLAGGDARRVELEQIARLVCGYQNRLLPSLLRTPEYACAALRAARPERFPTRLDRDIELLLRRQQILRADEPPQIWMLVGEAIVRSTELGAEVMRRQLEHLTRLTELPHITLQVIPEGTTVKTETPFSIFRFPERGLSDVICLEDPVVRTYLHHENDLHRYQLLLHRLSVKALEPEPSVELLKRLAGQIRE